ncbi:uncharacterized protein LOC107784512 [Nicotiana tabacum]|uniref:Uncharacterized protein LOC107784512 n=1 Tax=Nicotiana tabacum TaxID=4097 RepID=A0A1S3Z9P6_TOBAC|nr:PREDICTED: uncharacterized protein LOC107784512 [Nicotiana tabacum]
MVNHILTVPIGKHEHEDYPIWAKSEDGKFSTKIVYQKKVTIALMIFCSKKCHCCNAPKCETLQHVFIDSDLAVKLWNDFGGPLGIFHHKRPIRAVLQGWFGTIPVNMVHKMILNITPLAICWEVWKGITSCKYGDKKKIAYSRVYHNTFWILRTTLKLAFPSCDWDQPWHKICELVERLRHNPKTLIVLWELPPEGKVKLNTNGSVLHSSGLAGMGGIVRDCRGNMIVAFVVPKRCSSNNLAEAHAAKYGLEWCIQHGFGDIVLEIDSLIIANMLIKDTVENCKRKAIIQQTKQMLCQANVEVRHCWREANQVADGLAKHANTIQEGRILFAFQDLPRDAKGAYHLDKWQLPSMRIRYDKANFYVS